MKVPGHLLLEEIKLPAATEWMDPSLAWRFVRLTGGAAYWLGPSLTRPLVEGEVIIASPQASGLIRASQLGDVTLHAFNFSPEQIWGLLTVAERDYFATQAAVEHPEVEFLPSTHPTAQQFGALSADARAAGGLARRAEVLALIAPLFAGDFARHRTACQRGPTALHRFRDLVEKMPDSEIVNHTADALARLCGCSTRHFGRLFRQHFGITLRAKQIELRLLKARQLLRETDAKVVQVALETGYQSLSLFNAMFKERVGMTPSEWRRGASRRTARLARIAGGLLLAVWCGAVPSRAAEPAPPAAMTNAMPTFEVKGYELLGNTLLPPSVTDPIFRKHVGTHATFETIRAALADLQMAYRDRGEVTVSVALPQQQLTNGIVRVQVTEGRLAEINVVNNRFFNSNNVMRALPSLHTNILLNGLVLQQEIDRANASRDRQIYPVLGPGPEPGTSALTLKVKDRLPLHGRVEVNNNSTPDTPETRINVAAQYNNLWQLDHQFGAQYTLTPSALKPEGTDVPFYDEPLIASYSAFYRMPLAGVNGPPRDHDYTLSDFGYDEATHRFRPPPPTESGELLFYGSRSSSDTGQQLQSESVTPSQLPPEGGLQVSDRVSSDSLSINENLGARLVKPLPEFWGVHSTLSLGVDFKNYRISTVQTRGFQATVFVPESGTNGPPFVEYPSPPTYSSRSLFSSVQYLPFSLGWDAFRPDKLGSMAFNLNNSFQFANLLSSSDAFQQAAIAPGADGRYYVLTAGLTRQQTLYRDWGVRLHADGQWANQPLLNIEQFALGGQPGVRGYHDGEQYGDTGWRVQFEPHSPYLNVLMVDNTYALLARLYAFVDYGERYLLGPGVQLTPVPSRQANSAALFGAGFGFNATVGQHLDFRVQLGVPLLSTPTTPSGTLRFAFSLGAQF